MHGRLDPTHAPGAAPDAPSAPWTPRSFETGYTPKTEAQWRLVQTVVSMRRAGATFPEIAAHTGRSTGYTCVLFHIATDAKAYERWLVNCCRKHRPPEKRAAYLERERQRWRDMDPEERERRRAAHLQRQRERRALWTPERRQRETQRNEARRQAKEEGVPYAVVYERWGLL